MNWSMVTCAGELSAVNAIGTELCIPDKLGTDPIAYSGLNKEMDAAAKLGRNPVSKHQIQPEYGDEKADAGRDCRTRLARSSSQARTGKRKKTFFLLS